MSQEGPRVFHDRHLAGSGQLITRGQVPALSAEAPSFLLASMARVASQPSVRIWRRLPETALHVSEDNHGQTRLPD
ncbi:hypothetical protein VFPFJ_06252 [Purpureocillium lilacinum]|uniref:Uncharacterized protein n=1 Tax=Purpureocillium lilacinum TaxID=33203 RepID=A0A179HJN1_PURLI|nr:hypothetical protein VFPFJ_06252 [Purpureocillium lilacinum]OAQ89838.1 hypothetical protein VFPFJ_06252 [Purpureocillium lilacinum]